MALVDALLGGDGPRFGASLHRPPGHHAEPARAMGFCLFNNVAVAARRALDRWGAERVLILDWDVHHGNGTNDIFHSDPAVLFVSIHESPLYPGTGPAGDTGSGAGGGLHRQPARAGGDRRRRLVLAGRPRRGRARARVPPGPGPRSPPASTRTFATRWPAVTSPARATPQMAASMRGLADELDVPVGVVLEGGYDLVALAESTIATLEVLGAEDPPHRPPVALHPHAAQAAGRLAGRWPLVGVVAS